MNRLKKIGLILSSLFIVSCTSTDTFIELGKTVSKDIKVSTKTDTEVKDLSKKENKEILNNNEFQKIVFDRTNRTKNKNLKGVWVASVFNLDFPKTKGEGAEEQKREIEEIVKTIKSWGMNAIFLQVKPSSDALYKSSKLPWSSYLTGKEGLNPGYDPLEYFIKVAHNNNIEIHAWVNPYRVLTHNNKSVLSEINIANVHPEWVFEYANKLYLNPAKPGVVQYLYNAIEEIVTNYDIDGIHLDDYFYPYPEKGLALPDFDKEDFLKSNYQNLGDFRRANVDSLISNLSVSIHKIKPNLPFGISPFGIWRNKSNDERGSQTSGLQAYDDLYADILKWMENGWIDYVAPQIYWNVGHEQADYAELVEWWNDVAGKTNTLLYIGEGIYKFGEWDKDELAIHKLLRKQYQNVDGFILFRYNILKDNPQILDEVK